MSMFTWKMLKIGKKLCFPTAPSTWIPRTVESVLLSQDCFDRQPDLAGSSGSDDDEVDESSRCNPFSHYPVTTTTSTSSSNNTTPVTTTNSSLVSSSSNNIYYDLVTIGTSSCIKDAYMWSCNHRTTVECFFMYNQLEQGQYFSPKKKGDAFDVISLLKSGTHTDTDAAYLVRNNGVKVLVDSLRGKRILLCCVVVPCFWHSDISNTLRALFTACEHKNNKASADSKMIQMVMVAKMRSGWDNDEDAFNHFYSGFPSSWLAVPFSDTLRRDNVCNSLSLAKLPMALLVDRNQKVVFHNYTYEKNGFDYFRFCNPSYRFDWWEKHTKLDLVLNLDSRYVFNTNNYDSNKKVSISELKQKVVGLYLCFDGSFIRTLDLLSQQCKARNQEFEVVLVYLPYKDGVNPRLFQEAINHVLHYCNISDWWVSPFDDFVSRRLWEAVHFSEEDELVILDPHMNNADPFAKSVLYSLGVNSYPFTREFLVRRELEALRAFTLESLLVYNSRDHVLRIDDGNNVEEVPIRQLRGKNVILYIDEVETPEPETYQQVLDWYNGIKTTKAADDFEVVFVSTTPFGSPNLLPMPMPWLVCPFDQQHTSIVSRKTLSDDYSVCLIAFSKDGHMIKLDATDLLDKFRPNGFSNHHGLRKDIVDYFHFHYDIDMTGVFG